MKPSIPIYRLAALLISLFMLSHTSIANESTSITHANALNPYRNTDVPVFSADETAFLKHKAEVAMCVDPDWMPMERIRDGKHEGIAADFITIIEKRLGIPIKLVATDSWTESIEYAKSRKCDIYSLAMPTPERLEYMLFTKPYLRLPLVLATLKETSYIYDISTVTKRKLGVVAGYAFGEILREKYPNLDIVDVESLSKGMSMVEEGKIFGMIDTLASVGYAIQKRFPELKIAGKFDDFWELGIGVRNDKKLLYSSFERVIDTISATEAQEIINNWISVKYEKGIDYSLLWQVLAVVAVVLLFFFYRNRILKQNKESLEAVVQERTLELKHALEKSEFANEEKSRFLANMSHELRTPMHSILSFSSLGLKKSENEKLTGYFEKIYLSGSRLTALLNDLLDLSKLEAGSMEVDIAEHDLTECLTRVLAELGSLMNDKNITTTFNNKQVKACFDEKLISRVIVNFLSNAIKFSPENSTIDLQLTQDLATNQLRFSVRDYGIGVPDNELDTIFDRFVQSSKTRTGAGGTGLGLSICKEIIELHKGRIWAESPPEKGGKGTLVAFEIPIIQS